MPVKMRTLYAGPKGCYQAGAVADLGADEEARLLAGGLAARVEETEVVEAPPDAAPPVEAAVDVAAVAAQKAVSPAVRPAPAGRKRRG